MSKYVRLAKRLNNNKRGFLIVNPYLGKHVAQTPSEIINMFKEVAALGSNDMVAYKTLVIGFAETATALGATYAVKNGAYFLQTTREDMGNAKKIFFSEEHSHATAQYISAAEFDYISNHIERIVFIDDEITTGKTVKNAIAAIEAHSGKTYAYDMVSVLNSMTDDAISGFENDGIGVYYLERIDATAFDDFATNVSTDDNGIIVAKEHPRYVPKYSILNPKWSIDDTRIHVVDGFNYERQAEKLADEIANDINVENDKTVLVLGIEEFMYLPLRVANVLEQKGINVKFHATTRSPIVVKKDDNTYPFSERYDIHGCYEFDRETHLYNVDRYDEIIIVAEKKYVDKNGLNALISALENKAGNICVVNV